MCHDVIAVEYKGRVGNGEGRVVHQCQALMMYMLMTTYVSRDQVTWVMSILFDSHPSIYIKLLLQRHSHQDQFLHYN